jgi:flagellar biosynthetic protein FliQ
MEDGAVGELLREAMLVSLKLAGPPLAVALVIGTVMSLVQAVTQINEQTVAFVPKVIAICGTLILLGSFMMTALADFTRLLLDRAISGS